MKKTYCLVTGGAGFIGSHVVDHLIRMGKDVVVLDDLSGGFKENVNTSAVFVQGSITDVALVKKIFEDYTIDYVFHLAAYAAEGLSHFIRHYNYENNVLGSINLINESILSKVKCFVFTSSIAVYGAGQTPMVESLKPEPEDPYGIAKYSIELDLEAAHRMFGLNSIIFRPHNVYGERQNVGDKYRNVIGIFMNNILLDKELVVFGDGEQTRAFSHIDDVAPIIAKSAFSPEVYNQTFNIGADTPYTVNELIDVIAEAMSVTPKVMYAEARKEVLHAYSDHSKVKEAFNLKNDPINLKDGIQKMVAWVHKHGARETEKFKNIEILENLPESWR